MLTTMGMISGVMTNPPALAAANNADHHRCARGDLRQRLPGVLIFKILLAQIVGSDPTAFLTLAHG